jgi:hypothetical protein
VSPQFFDMGPESGPPPLALPDHAMARLDDARKWARVLAVVGFSLSGLMALSLVGTLLSLRMETVNNTRLLAFVPLVAAVFATLSGSAMLWAYGGNVRDFFKSGEPALTRAFRSARHLLTLWTLFAALVCLASLLTTLRGLL